MIGLPKKIDLCFQDTTLLPHAVPFQRNSGFQSSKHDLIKFINIGQSLNISSIIDLWVELRRCASSRSPEPKEFNKASRSIAAQKCCR